MKSDNVGALRIRRSIRSLITTCAASISVTSKKKQSARDILEFALLHCRERYPGYECSGVNLFYLHTLNQFNCNDQNKFDEIPLSFDILDMFLLKAEQGYGQWYSVPGNNLAFDLTEEAEVLVGFIVGSVLNLLPWRNDDTFELHMHGTQLDPGDYQIVLTDMFIFCKLLNSPKGKFRMISETFEYTLRILEGKVQGRRKRRGPKLAINHKARELEIERLPKAQQIDRGMSR